MADGLDPGLRPTEKQWTMLEDLRASGEFCCTYLEHHAGRGWRVVVVRDGEAHRELELDPGWHSTAGKAIAAAFRAWKGGSQAEPRPRSDFDKAWSWLPAEDEWKLFWELCSALHLSGVRLNSDYTFGWEVEARSLRAGEGGWRLLKPTFDNQAGVAIRAGFDLWRDFQR